MEMRGCCCLWLRAIDWGRWEQTGLVVVQRTGPVQMLYDAENYSVKIANCDITKEKQGKVRRLRDKCR